MRKEICVGSSETISEMKITRPEYQFIKLRSKVHSLPGDFQPVNDPAYPLKCVKCSSSTEDDKDHSVHPII